VIIHFFRNVNRGLWVGKGGRNVKMTPRLCSKILGSTLQISLHSGWTKLWTCYQLFWQKFTHIKMLFILDEERHFAYSLMYQCVYVTSAEDGPTEHLSVYVQHLWWKLILCFTFHV